MTNKKNKYPIRKMGKHCGYDEYEDGSIKIAPMYADSFQKANEEAAAVDALLRAVTEQCHRLLVPITAAQQSFWKSLEEDYDFDFEKFDYTYNQQTKIITRTEKPSDTVKEESA
jgi:hypothetical protein